MIKVNWLISTTVRASTGSVRSITWVLLLSLLLVSSYRNMLSARFLRVNKFHSIVSRGRVSPLQLQSIHGKDVTIRLNSNNAIDSKTLDRSEKQRVKHISGLDGYICSKGKGGWWKLVLVDTVTSEEKVSLSV